MYFPECFAMNAGISAMYFLNPPKSFTDKSSTKYAFIPLPREAASDQFAVRMEGVEIALRDWSCARYRRTPRIAVLVCSVQLDQIVEIDVRSMNATAVRRRDLPKPYQNYSATPKTTTPSSTAC